MKNIFTIPTDSIEILIMNMENFRDSLRKGLMDDFPTAPYLADTKTD